MKLEFSGKEEVNASIGKVFESLTNAEYLAKSIPDAEEVKVVSKYELEAKVKVKISVFSSSVKVRMKIEPENDKRVRLIASSSGAGSTVDITTYFYLVPSNSNTIIEWSAFVSISGLMAGLGSSTLKVFSEKYIKRVIENMHKVLDEKN